jgi:hypothetical protein
VQATNVTNVTNPKKNRISELYVGRPILAAAAFRGGFPNAHNPNSNSISRRFLNFPPSLSPNSPQPPLTYSQEAGVSQWTPGRDTHKVLEALGVLA